MYMPKYVDLVEHTLRLPEVGQPIVRRAEGLRQRAIEIQQEIDRLEQSFDDFVFEVRELWTKEERDGTIFQS